MVSTWDLLREDGRNWPDRGFYRDLIARFGTPALDVGCSTGRLLLDFLAEGLAIDGVDSSAEMLDLCRKKAEERGLRPGLYQQRMESLDLPRKYRTILVPSSSFQLVTQRDAAEAAMRRLHDHLEPRGALAMPFMVVTETEASDWQLTAERTRPEDGALVRRWSRSWNDLEQQLQHSLDRFEIVVDGNVVDFEEHERSPGLRWYTQAQALDLYARAGFAEIETFRGFSFEPAGPGDALFSVVGIRRGSPVAT